MSRADELLAQYQTKINKIGQWIAIRRYSGPTASRTWTDTAAKAYIKYEPAKEFVGAVIQNYAVVYALVDTLLGPPFDSRPINTNDKLLTAFTGFDDLGTAPPVDVDSHVTNPKETAIFSIMKRAPSGKLIAYEIHAVG